MATQALTIPNTDSNMGKDSIMSAIEQKTVVPEKENWSDTRAAAIAIGDFRKDETYRQMNHDFRYKTADELYLGWVPRKTWEGTKIPRSAVAVHMVLEQLEALLPSLIGNLFPDDNSLSFDTTPEPTSNYQQAQSVRELVASQLRDLGIREFVSLREILRRFKKSSLLYGNGILEFGWSQKTITRDEWQRVNIPQRQQVPGPDGQPTWAPTGQYKSIVRHNLAQIPISKPIVQNVDIRDFYWDANCNSPNIQNAGHCEHRSFMTINDLIEYDGQEGFTLPRRGGTGSEVALDILLDLAHQKKGAPADQVKQVQESWRSVSYTPIQDQSVDPNLARLEIIRYWQRNRHVWITRGYSQPFYNAPNKYGVLPFITEAYIDLPGRWAGLSLGDICETDQRLAETIINARIDELALLIHSPLVKKRGISLPLSQQKMRPGLIWESDDPANDYRRVETGNVTQTAYLEVNEANNRASRKTGVTDTNVIGVATSGGNSANRTATGIQSQGAAASKRIQYQVENSEDQVVVPLLNAIYAMDQKFLDPNTMIQIVGPNGMPQVIDPVEILNSSVRFTMTASGRMRQRQGLATGGLAVIEQTLLNPALLEFMVSMGQVPDMPNFVDLLTTTFNLPRKSLFRTAQPQELQQMQQRKMAPELMRKQMQDDRIQGESQRQDASDETKIIMALFKALVTPQAAHEILNGLTGMQLDTHTGKEPKPATPRPQ